MASDQRHQSKLRLSWCCSQFSIELFRPENYIIGHDDKFYSVASGIIVAAKHSCSVCGLITPPTAEMPLGLMQIYDPSNKYDVKKVGSFKSICLFCHAAKNIYAAIDNGRYTFVLQPKLSQFEINSIFLICAGLEKDKMGFDAKRRELLSNIYESTGNMIAIMPEQSGRALGDETMEKERRIRGFIRNICLRYPSDEASTGAHKILEHVRVFPLISEFDREGEYLLKSIIPTLNSSFV